MTRQARWAKQARQRLIEDLGGRCVKCGTVDCLEFDHIDPRSRRWEAHREGSYKRVLLYRVECRMGLIQLLCEKCNKKKGDKLETAHPLFNWPQRRD